METTAMIIISIIILTFIFFYIETIMIAFFGAYFTIWFFTGLGLGPAYFIVSNTWLNQMPYTYTLLLWVISCIPVIIGFVLWNHIEKYKNFKRNIKNKIKFFFNVFNI